VGQVSQLPAHGHGEGETFAALGHVGRRDGGLVLQHTNQK
jgi:hypothetical protein